MKKVYLFLILIFLSSCFFSKDTNYYLINKNDEIKDVKQCVLFKPLLVEVGRIELSDYLKKDGIIIREDNNRIDLSDTELWISSLDEQIAETIKSYLEKSFHLNKDIEVCKYPCDKEIKDEDKISIYLFVNSFEYDKDQEKVMLNMNARFYLNGELVKKKIIKRDIYEVNDSYDDIVENMGKALKDTSQVFSKLVCDIAK